MSKIANIDLDGTTTDHTTRSQLQVDHPKPSQNQMSSRSQRLQDVCLQRKPPGAIRSRQVYKTNGPAQLTSEHLHQPHFIWTAFSSPSSTLLLSWHPTMISPNMDSRTMPMPRDSNQVIPSFRELEAKVEANMLEDKGERLRRGEGKGDIVYVDNPFPPYPLQGSRIPPDPSHNVCILDPFARIISDHQ